MNKTLQYDKDELKRLCRAHHVRRLGVFGFREIDAANAASDIDLLVEYEQECVPGLLGFLELEEELAELFEDHKIDLVSRGGLSPYLRNKNLETRSPLYERWFTPEVAPKIRDTLEKM